jgi:hypothetical protein
VEGSSLADAGVVPDPREIAEMFGNAAFTPRGQESIDGEPCDVYTYAEAEQSGALWIGRRDALIRKIEGNQPAGEYILRFADFNAPIEIKAPI